MEVSRNGSPVAVLHISQEPGERRAPGRLSGWTPTLDAPCFPSLSTSWSVALGNRPNGSRYCLCWDSIFSESFLLGSFLGRCKWQ